MNKQAILRSAKKSGEAVARNTQPIYRYLQPARNALSRLTAKWKPDNIRHNAYSKKRKYRPTRLPPSNQPRLPGYLSLRQPFSKIYIYTLCRAPLARSAAAPRSNLAART